MTALDYTLLSEAYDALEAVQVHTGLTLTEMLEEPDTLGDLLYRLQVRIHGRLAADAKRKPDLADAGTAAGDALDSVTECPGCYRTIEVCNADPCEKRQGELDEDEGPDQGPCCSCGAECGPVAWTPTGGDPHCSDCAGSSHALSVVLEAAQKDLLDQVRWRAPEQARDTIDRVVALLADTLTKPIEPTGSGRTPIHDALERPDVT